MQDNVKLMEHCNLPIMRSHAGGGSSSANVIVAIKAERYMAKKALVWALSHVICPGDSVALLAVFDEDEKKGKTSEVISTLDVIVYFDSLVL